jgi:orotidine-5'-phosphate decarboxylase
MERKVICALDTSSLEEALAAARRLVPYVGAFKVGHALTLVHGLDVLGRFQDLGVERVFLDLKFHDIPNSVALAVREAARRRVWMLTLHISGGPAMMTAAVEEARSFGDTEAPLLAGVSVLTSLDQRTLTDHLGVQRSITEHMCHLSQLAVDCGLDGVVCSPQEAGAVRMQIGHAGIIVVPGIRRPGADPHDQLRVGSASQALADGADYLVIGRPLMVAEDPVATLASFQLHHGGSAPAGGARP